MHINYYRKIIEEIKNRGLNEGWTKQKIEDEITLAFRQAERREEIAKEEKENDIYANLI